MGQAKRRGTAEQRQQEAQQAAAARTREIDARRREATSLELLTGQRRATEGLPVVRVGSRRAMASLIVMSVLAGIDAIDDRGK